MNIDRMINMFINLFMRRIMMTVINKIIGTGMRFGRRVTRSFGGGKPAVTEEQKPQLNDFSRRD